jgi:hypothetical protein
MIQVSNNFVRFSNYTRLSSSGVKILAVFTGTPPTSADIDAMKDADINNNGDLRMDAIFNWASTQGDTCLQVTAYDKDFAPRFPNVKMVQWPLSESPADFQYIDEGIPGWFVFAVTSNGGTASSMTITDITTSNFYTPIAYFGTAGDEESEADLKLLGGYLDQREYSATDFEVIFS